MVLTSRRLSTSSLVRINYISYYVQLFIEALKKGYFLRQDSFGGDFFDFFLHLSQFNRTFAKIFFNNNDDKGFPQGGNHHSRA